MSNTFFSKLMLKLKIESEFYLVHKIGWKKPRSGEIIPKFHLKKLLPVNACIVDCGAHIGADSVELAKTFPNCTIHAFEPVPELYKILQYNVRRYKNIFCYPLALSSQNGIAEMYVSSGDSDASSSLNRPAAHLQDHVGVKFDNIIKVNTMTLDSWALLHGIKAIDFLWLDMQGHEKEMLDAAPEMMATVKAIHTEVSTKNSYEGVTLYEDYKRWIQERGFRLFMEAIPRNIDMGNALFLKTK
jgi:2-O-methyltransferase